jgi:uncharacterized protein with ATP-grasp and redox domains
MKRSAYSRSLGRSAARYVVTVMGLGDPYTEQEANQTCRHLVQFAMRAIRADRTRVARASLPSQKGAAR